MEKQREIVYKEACVEEDEIDLVELWQTIWKHRKFVVAFTGFITVLAIIISLLMTNIYKSSAVILPTQQGGEKGSSILSNFGGIASMVGINLPISSGSQDIMALLKSDSLKREVITKYNLLPIILYKQWDNRTKTWKKSSKGIIGSLKELIGISSKQQANNEEEKRLATALKIFSNNLNINEDKKLGTITISFEWRDPKIAADVVKDILDMLKKRMTTEAIEIATKRKQMLENELSKTSDPTIQQKLYALIAKQAETIAMAKVSEDFAFKVIDPPVVPVFKYKPKRALITIVAFITGLLLSIFLVFFIEFVKNTKQRIKEEAEV